MSARASSPRLHDLSLQFSNGTDGEHSVCDKGLFKCVSRSYTRSYRPGPAGGRRSSEIVRDRREPPLRDAQDSLRVPDAARLFHDRADQRDRTAAHGQSCVGPGRIRMAGRLARRRTRRGQQWPDDDADDAPGRRAQRRPGVRVRRHQRARRCLACPRHRAAQARRQAPAARAAFALVDTHSRRQGCWMGTTQRYTGRIYRRCASNSRAY